MKKLLISALFAAFLVACSEKEPAVSDLKKAHAIEVSLETKHLNDTSVLLITRQNVFLKGKLVIGAVNTIFHNEFIIFIVKHIGDR